MRRTLSVRRLDSAYFVVRQLQSDSLDSNGVCLFSQVQIMEKLMGSWEKLSLSESKGSKFSIRDDPGAQERVLAANFHTGRVLNMEAIAKTFTLLWKTIKVFEIRDMGDHRVMFVFPDAADVDRVLMGEPWTFDRHLVVLEKMNINDGFEDLSFNQTSFWVQVHDLPIRSSSLEVAMEIVSMMGVDDHFGKPKRKKKPSNMSRKELVSG